MAFEFSWQEKDEKDQKMESRLPGFIYLLWMNGIPLVQRAFTYHGNLISKSRITYYNLRITLWSPVPRHGANLVSVTDHAANFGIEHGVKTICHPPSGSSLQCRRFSVCSRMWRDRVDSPPCWFSKSGKVGRWVGEGGKEFPSPSPVNLLST